MVVDSKKNNEKIKYMAEHVLRKNLNFSNFSSTFIASVPTTSK